MKPSEGTMVLIKTPYWLGIAADALWAVALFYPPLFGSLTGTPDFDPDMQVRLIMGIGGTVMAGWTLLLLWAVRRPIERRFVILLTAYPVVLGMFIVSLLGYLDGRTSNLWILAKTVVLMASMTTSYILSGKIRSG
jgi:hypothetical protein